MTKSDKKHPIKPKTSSKRFYTKILRKYPLRSQYVDKNHYLWNAEIGDVIFWHHSSKPKAFRVFDFWSRVNNYDKKELPYLKCREIGWVKDEAGNIIKPTDEKPEDGLVWKISLTDMHCSIWDMGSKAIGTH